MLHYFKDNRKGLQNFAVYLGSECAEFNQIIIVGKIQKQFNQLHQNKLTNYLKDLCLGIYSKGVDE